MRPLANFKASALNRSATLPPLRLQALSGRKIKNGSERIVAGQVWGHCVRVHLHGTGQDAGQDRRSGEHALNMDQNIPPQFLEPEGDPAAKTGVTIRAK